jgi:dTDP-4-amino-4,6-dideoxygalactose transaminase
MPWLRICVDRCRCDAHLCLHMSDSNQKRIYLSSPHMGGEELALVQEAFATNWIAPLGPHVDGFEKEFAEEVGSAHAAALSSGTAALHLALRLAGVQQDDEVFVSTLTFSASVNPILYEKARPVFIDSDRTSWNMDPQVLAEALEAKAKAGKLPKAVILVHLYGQSADIDAVQALCDRYGVQLIEDAAEALGAVYYGRSEMGDGRSEFGDASSEQSAQGAGSSELEAQGSKLKAGVTPGSRGRMGIYSFNGNKIITTSGGGMLVSNDQSLVEKARFLATQARDPAPHYQHSEVGFNYRMSNVLAGIGRGQLKVLASHVNARRANCAAYQEAFSDIAGLEFMPEASFGRCTRWLTCITLDPEKADVDRDTVRLALEGENIEARPVWKPMHCQPIFAEYEKFGGDVAEDLFEKGLCLPSGSNLAREDLDRVVAAMLRVLKR